MPHIHIDGLSIRRVAQTCFACFYQVRPLDMRALSNFEEPGKLKIEDGDLITVLEGRFVTYSSSLISGLKYSHIVRTLRNV